MAQVTEMVEIPLVEGKHPEDPTSDLNPLFTKMVQTILSQPGAQRLHWGRQMENPSTGNLFIDWDSIQDHQKFMTSDIYPPFMEGVLGLVAGAPSIQHVHFDPHPPSDPLKLGGATEVLSIFFPASYSDEDQNTFEARVKKFVEIVKADTPDVKAIAGGWADEEVDIPGTEGKGRVYTTLIAWTSQQAHLDYRNTQSFKDNIHLLRGAKDVRGVKVFHISTEESLKQ